MMREGFTTNGEQLRVLQVSTLEMKGGAARIAWNLHSAYGKRGIRSWMAVGQKETADTNVFQIPNEEARGLWARSLLHMSHKIRIGRHYPGAWSLSLLLADIAEPTRKWDYYRGIEDFRYPASGRVLQLPPERPDIVHCHNLHGDYFDLRALPRLSHEVPVALTLHDTWLLSGHCAYSLDCERWRTGCGRCPSLTLPPPSRRDATSYNWHRKRDIYTRCRFHIVTPSRWLMDKVEESILAPAVVEGRVIHNGVDLSVFCPGDKQAARVALGLPQDAAIVLFTGLNVTNSPYKDYTTIKDALSRIAFQNEGRKLLLLCLGGGQGEEKLGIARIRFIGHQKDLNKVAQFYQAADLYLHAAHADTFPNVILEALACGTPVVATAVGGIPEQVDDGVTGFLVPPGDANAMADCIKLLLVDSELRCRFAVEAAESACRRFSLNQQVDTYLDWYGEILGERSIRKSKRV